MKALALSPYTPVLHRLASQMRAWPLALWQAACRHAERPDRFVPYY